MAIRARATITILLHLLLLLMNDSFLSKYACKSFYDFMITNTYARPIGCTINSQELICLESKPWSRKLSEPQSSKYGSVNAISDKRLTNERTVWQSHSLLQLHGRSVVKFWLVAYHSTSYQRAIIIKMPKTTALLPPSSTSTNTYRQQPTFHAYPACEALGARTADG